MLTTLNNVGSKTLFNAVFIRPEQVVRFLLRAAFRCITQTQRSISILLIDRLEEFQSIVLEV